MKKLKNLFNKKYRLHWAIAIIVIVIIGFIFFRNGEKAETIVVHPGEFLQQVAVSGKIVATEILDLSFEQTGQIKGIYVKEGDGIKSGKLLANQDTLQLNAQLAEMKAGIELQEAKLDQLLAGALPEDIKVSENKVASAQQNLDNAYDNSLTELESAYDYIYNANNTALSIQNSYFSASDQQGIKVQQSRKKIQENMADAKNYLEIQSSI